MTKNKKRWSVAGFVDWNEYSIDELVSYLEKAIQCETKAIEDASDIKKLVNFYKNTNKLDIDYNDPALKDISDRLYRKYYFYSSGLAYSICKMIDYYKDKNNSSEK